MAEQHRAWAPFPAQPTETTLQVTATFGANPGGLEMLSHVPEGLSVGAPLVVVLHGCGQTAAGYASDAGWLTLADRLGFAILAPQQTSANNPNRCFNWFSPGDIHRGQGEAASIAAMIACLVQRESLDARRVFVTGLSAGGAMTMAMLASYPELFAGGAVIAGLPYGVANGVTQAMTTMQQSDHRSPTELARLIPPNLHRYPRLTVWHGGADHVVSPENAEAIAAQWAVAQGLTTTPDETGVDGRRTRRAWRGKTGGEPALELNLIQGLGHGAPLSTRGEDGLGHVAPYMLETGVSSSEEIAKFWGLAPPVGPGARSSTASTKAPPNPSLVFDTSFGLGDRVLSSVKDHVPPGVQDVIASALKRAGLVKS